MAGALYVKIDGIEGDSEDKDHSGFFDATAFSFSGQSPTDPTTMLPRGNRVYSPFSFTIKHDGNLATLYQYMNDNKDTSVTVQWRVQAKTGKINGIDMSLKDARIISLSTQVTEENGTVTSSTKVQMGYGSADLTANGEKNAGIESAWETRAHA